MRTGHCFIGLKYDGIVVKWGGEIVNFKVLKVWYYVLWNIQCQFGVDGVR